MVANLRETTRRTKDWLESNLTRIAGLMQGHRDLVEVADLILRELTPLVNAQSGAFFLAEADGARHRATELEFIAGYGTAGATGPTGVRRAGARPGRAGRPEKKRILIEDAPPDYITIDSGLGGRAPASIVILPDPVRGPGARRRSSWPRSAGSPTSTWRSSTSSSTPSASRSTPSSPTPVPRRCSPSPSGWRAAPGVQVSRTNCSAPARTSCSAPTPELEEKAAPDWPHSSAVQVGVPGEHVARAAHAAELAADPGPAARRQPRRAALRAGGATSRPPSTGPAPTCSS